jgi:iron complex transport system substrate-binding protein
VGVTSYCDYPSEAKNKAKIGGYYTPDVEKIVALAPDIVFAAGESHAKYIRVLEQAGIRVVSLEPKNMNELIAAIDLISLFIGEKERGKELHAGLTEQLDEVRRLTAELTPKRVFLEVWDAPLLTIGGKSHINDNPMDYMRSDMEALYAYNPEAYIVVSHSRGNVRSFAARPELSDITAVKEKKVYKILEDVLTRVGPRNFTGLRQIAEILHPEAVKKRREE